MGILKHKDLNRLFEFSLFIKGGYELLEITIGFLLLFINSSTIFSLIGILFRKELIEDPRDFIATHAMNFLSTFSSSSKLILALYLIVYGTIKIVLVASVLMKKIQVYPAAIFIFLIILIYELYRFMLVPSFLIALLCVLDIFVIWFTYLEYQHLSLMKPVTSKRL